MNRAEWRGAGRLSWATCFTTQASGVGSEWRAVGRFSSATCFTTPASGVGSEWRDGARPAAQPASIARPAPRLTGVAKVWYY